MEDYTIDGSYSVKKNSQDNSTADKIERLETTAAPPSKKPRVGSRAEGKALKKQ